MKIEIREDEAAISVLVSVKPIHKKNYNVKIAFLTKDIIKILSEKNIKVGKCIKSPNIVTNLKKEKDLSGEWIFEKVKPPPPKKVAPPKKNPKKVKKTLDKSPEDVIIYIQEETLPSKED
jgi:hypothetical protein